MIGVELKWISADVVHSSEIPCFPLATLLRGDPILDRNEEGAEAGCLDYRLTLISTRRFIARPSSVLFDEIGWVSP